MIDAKYFSKLHVQTVINLTQNPSLNCSSNKQKWLVFKKKLLQLYLNMQHFYMFNYYYYTVPNSMPYWFNLKLQSLSPRVASISSPSTFHNDAVLWCSIRPIHCYQFALWYLTHLSTLLWSPSLKIPRLYPTCNEKNLCLNFPFLTCLQ